MVKNKSVDKIIKILKKNNFVYRRIFRVHQKVKITKTWKKTKRLIFKSSSFGDDSDRALQKNDGTWTYFANDIGYHSTKIKKNMIV